jgi:hypothetical protein
MCDCGFILPDVWSLTVLGVSSAAFALSGVYFANSKKIKKGMDRNIRDNGPIINP